MATEQSTAVATERDRFAKYAGGLAGLIGLWVAVSPFVLSGPFGSGTPLYSNVVAGIAVLALAAFDAYGTRSAAETDENTPAEWSGWLAALAGLWIAASPFVLNGSVGTGAPLYSNVAAGVVALVLAAYSGYALHSRE